VTAWFFRVDAWVIALVFSAVLTLVWAVAGRKRGAACARQPGTMKGEEALLALLGLLLAFSFGMSLDRHDRRRGLAVADANAIGDFYTTTRLVGEPARTELHGVVRDYVVLRLSATGDDAPIVLDEAMLRRSAALHATMLELVGQAVQDESRAPVAVVLVQTLNGLTSSHAAWLMACREHLPGSIVLLLLAASMLGISILAKNDAPRSLAVLAFVALVSFLVFVILDLNQPRRGLITVSREPMERLHAAIVADEQAP
jgi:hypothetical protein